MIPSNYSPPRHVDGVHTISNHHVQHQGNKGLKQIAEEHNLFQSPTCSKAQHRKLFIQISSVGKIDALTSRTCLPQVESAPKKTKKCVRFSRRTAPAKTSLVTLPMDLSKSEKEKVWYQKANYKSFKEDMVQAVVSEKQQKMKRKGYPSSYIQSLERIYSSAENKLIDTTLSMQIIECAITNDPSRRGIEAYLINPPFYADRDSYRSSIVSFFQKLQSNNLLYPDETSKAEALREFSIQSTHTSKSFARAMGDIDAAIAKKLSKCKTNTSCFRAKPRV